MRDPDPYLCDVCQTRKAPSNGWWLGHFATGMVFIFEWNRFDEFKPAWKFESLDALAHLCGITCAAKWCGMRLAGESKDV